MTLTKKPKKKVCNHPKVKGEPTSYCDWHQWAEYRYAKGWTQKWCEKCQLFATWVKPKK